MGLTRIAGTVLCLGALAATGCIMPDEMSQMRKEIGDVQQQLHRVRRDQDESLAQVRQIVDQSARSQGADTVSREDLAEILLRIDQVSRRVATTDERVRDLQQLVDRYAQDLRQTRVEARRNPAPIFESTPTEPDIAPMPGAESTTTTPTRTEPLPDPEALYNTAYADFSKGNFALAISGFDEYRDRFSESPLADNATYWVGECHFSQGNYPAAIATFDTLLDRYPESDKAAAGDLKKALAYLEQNSLGQAIVQLNYVIGSYPETDEARIAQDKLASLGGERN